MSKPTWAAMVQVMQQNQEQRPKRRNKQQTQRPLPMRCVREEHFALLSAAGY